jgi:DNA invertase Pin-like site-specific DNA recombinase
MESSKRQKVTAEHLKRNAYLYVRQACRSGMPEETESIDRQYALRQEAIRLGWREEQVITIDCDVGRSGTSSDRAGFQRLVAEIRLGRAGIVIALDVSRLTREASDWYRLLENCALTRTLLLAEDGLYDPSCLGDRMLLGLARTLSEPGPSRRARETVAKAVS